VLYVRWSLACAYLAFSFKLHEIRFLRYPMMIRVFAFIFLIFAFHPCRAQIPVNNPIDPADTELVNAVDFLSSYFHEFDNGRSPDYTKYWDAQDCKDYKHPDQLLYGINTEWPTYRIGRPTILYAKPENGYVHIKTLFGRGDSTGKVSVMSITNHYIRHDDHNNLYFINPVRLAAKNWNTTVVGTITYHYPSYHHFDKSKAKVLTDKIATLQHDWGLEPINIRYYFADTKEELEHLRGFDFTVAMGNRDKPSGMSDDTDNIVYCGGWGENYFHEVVHVYLNRHYTQSPLREGLAVFYGGSLGHELKWHITRLNEYLERHPQLDLERDNFYYMDNFTNPNSTIMGLLCLDAYNRSGIGGLKRIMAYTSLDDIMLTEYGIRRGDWNAFLRKLISDNSHA